jgi:hypothetical protein
MNKMHRSSADRGLYFSERSGNYMLPFLKAIKQIAVMVTLHVVTNSK